MPEHVPNASRPVRVCFVVENLMAAGTELWILRLIERLDRQRVTPLLCLTDGSSELSRGLEPADCPVLRLELPNLKSLRLPAAAAKLKRFLSQHQVDVVQVHHADPTYLAVPIARWARVPAIVQTKYDVGYWLRGMDLRLHRWLRRWVDVTVANCEACRRAAIEQENAPADQVVVIDNGIPTDKLLALPAMTASSFQEAEIRVGMLANLRPIKDPENLLRAAFQLAHDSDQLSFHFAGRGDLQSSMQTSIDQQRLQDRIRLHGHVRETVKFLGQLHVFVLCSKSEGLPHALLEAMAAGRAVIATDVGGNRELITHEVNGLLVPPEDTPSLVNAIRRLASDGEFAAQLGQAARKHVAHRFSLESMTERFEAFYDRLRRRSSDSSGYVIPQLDAEGVSHNETPHEQRPSKDPLRPTA